MGDLSFDRVRLSFDRVRAGIGATRLCNNLAPERSSSRAVRERAKQERLESEKLRVSAPGGKLS